MRPLPAVDPVPLFPPERAALLDFLSQLDESDWARDTSCPGWSLKDIAAHLLADDLGRLSGARDAYRGWRFEPANAETIESDLLTFINAQNEAWVAATRRLSPRVIIDLLRWSGAETQRYFESLDLDAPANIGVSWAGEQQSANWFDLARELTERWMHQAQIREAAGSQPLYDPAIFAPVLDTFVRALPHAFRSREAPPGTTVRLEIALVGAPAPTLRYDLVRSDTGWLLGLGGDGQPAATVSTDGDTAWRTFTKGLPKPEAIARSTLSGNARLAEKVFDTVSIIA